MSHKWILLAEDDANDARLTLHVLTDSSASVEVVRVRDGAEALDCLFRRDAFKSRDTGPPSLVLLDLKMPKVDGFAVLKQIKGDGEMKTIPVAIFTSSREPADLNRCYELGTNAYVVKPVDFEKFIEALEEIKKFWMDYNESPPVGTGADAAFRLRAQLPPDKERHAIDE